MNGKERYIHNKREMRKRKKKMRAYICMGIMCLACVFSFWVGKNVGTVQAQKRTDTEVSVMENVEIGEDGGAGTMQGDVVQGDTAQDDVVNSMQADFGEQGVCGANGEKPNGGVTGTAESNGKNGESEKEGLFPDLDKSEIVLVNKNNKLPDDYEVTLKKLPDGTNKAAEEAYKPMCDMLKAARKDGMILEVCSSYRSVDRQKELFEEDMRMLVRRGYSYLDAYDEVASETMPPGYSEHSTGLAFDIVALDYQMLDKKQETTEENQWLREHCAEYGFILRYPKEKEDITGISYESWHFRYVGVEIAEYIMEKGITLEEFLEE